MEKEKLEKALLEHKNLRDLAFIDRFCHKSEFIGNDGKPVHLCRPVDVNEVMSFLYEFDADLLDKIQHGTA